MVDPDRKMKAIKTMIAGAVLGGLLTLTSVAADNTPKAGKPKPYAQTTCPVTGEKLGAMGKPYVYVYKDREIKFCCKGCVKEFEKDPAKYIKKLEEGEKKGKAAEASH